MSEHVHLRTLEGGSVARRITRAAVLTAIVLVGLSAGAATARADLLQPILGGGCGSMSKAFAAWGDSASYYFPSNGGFESGASGWNLSNGAGVVGGNELFQLHGNSDSQSALLPARSTASTSVCAGTLYGAVRFFAVSADGQPARVHVRVLTRSLLGVLAVLDGGSFSVGTTWAPTPVIYSTFSGLATTVSASKAMQIQITVDSGNVQIDDLYVDPLLTKT
jgi:hypothetical protein